MMCASLTIQPVKVNLQTLAKVASHFIASGHLDMTKSANGGCMLETVTLQRYRLSPQMTGQLTDIHGRCLYK